MKKTEIRGADVQSLIDEFVAIGLAQEKADLYGEISKYNRLFDRMLEIARELKRRGPEELSALSSLYEHPSGQVRLKAAIYSLGVKPLEARRTLEILASQNEYPPTANARGILKSFDEGRFSPL